jgi:hypothetical protein
MVVMGIASLVEKYPRFLREGWERNGREGLWYGLRAPVRYPLGHAIRKTNQAYVNYVKNPGESIWSHEWDVLLILDACRVDLLHEVKDDYDFLNSIQTQQSLGSMSRDWMTRNFSEKFSEKVSETAYVTGNPFSRTISTEFDVFDEVWKYAWDDEKKTVPPRPMTDRAIETWRSGADRMIVHYMQPHGPFLSRPEMGQYGSPEDFGTGFGTLWNETEHTIPKSEVWEAYRNNLKIVLEDVKLFLKSVDADTVAISADHGNGVGEWGIYGHPDDVLINEIRTVPWTTTQAEDIGGYEITTEKEGNASADVTDRLRALGYTR